MPTPSLRKVFGIYLEQVRVAHGMTQAVLASRLELSQSFMSEMERGDKDPSVETIGMVLDVFGVSVSGWCRAMRRIADELTGAVAEDETVPAMSKPPRRGPGSSSPGTPPRVEVVDRDGKRSHVRPDSGIASGAKGKLEQPPTGRDGGHRRSGK
jgi:transcriptional regulator with XRE-family HTH domain